MNYNKLNIYVNSISYLLDIFIAKIIILFFMVLKLYMIHTPQVCITDNMYACIIHTNLMWALNCAYNSLKSNQCYKYFRHTFRF